jgi:integrase/recombinase XerC
MSVDPTAIAAAIAGLLDSAGLDLDDLAGLLGSSSTTPTVSQAVADLLEVNDLSPTSLRTYSSYWRLFEEHYGERRMGELGPRDIQSVVNTARQRAVDSNARKNEKRQARGRQPRQTDGRGAAENCIRAIRALYRATYEELGRPPASSPAHRVKVPRRRASRRRALSDGELRDLFTHAASSGYDRDLDLLLLRTAYETGARQEGLLNLRLEDIDLHRQTVMLSEKFEDRREQPISKELMGQLLAHAAERTGPKVTTGPVFWYQARGDRPATPLTSRRFDSLFERLRGVVPWADASDVSLHYIRHTIARKMERAGGKAVARRFLGHSRQSGDATDLYTAAVPTEVVTIWSQVMGVPHPLADHHHR